MDFLLTCLCASPLLAVLPLLALLVWRSRFRVPPVLRRVLCAGLGWHAPPHLWLHIRRDGIDQYATCPWCLFEGRIDSRGNLV